MNRRRFAHATVVALFGTLLIPACRTNMAPEQQVEDARITAAVKVRLAKDVRPATVANIEVNTTSGIVTLTGTANHEEERKAAARAAYATKGVKKVINNVQIPQSLPPPKSS
jgi:osmotically-inducible protein OsmY